MRTTTAAWIAVAILACSPSSDLSTDETATLLPNARRPESGVLSGGQPSPEQLSALAAAGYRTVLNLRTAKEPGSRRPEVEALGMQYVELPIEGAADLTEENARLFADLLTEAERPIVVHCGSGNRVGGLFALKAYFVDEAPVDEALEIGEKSGLTRLRGAVAERLHEAEAGP